MLRPRKDGHEQPVQHLLARRPCPAPSLAANAIAACSCWRHAPLRSVVVTRRKTAVMWGVRDLFAAGFRWQGPVLRLRGEQLLHQVRLLAEQQVVPRLLQEVLPGAVSSEPPLILHQSHATAAHLTWLTGLELPAAGRSEEVRRDTRDVLAA